MTVNYFKLCLVQISVFLAVISQNIKLGQCVNAHVSLTVEGEGFHRYLIYQINLDNLVDGCNMALHLKLPPTLYTDINELNDLGRLGVTTACSIGETNVELFMEKANSQNVTICSPVIGNKSTLMFPIHKRYQYPSENNTYMTITLPKPNLLLGCKERIRKYRISKIDLCSSCAEVVPKWREITYILEKENTSWSIPVGNLRMLTTVTYITLLLTILCTMFLMRTVWKAVPSTHEKQE
ncbi:phosphatidylinositol-glycan biosynthesis class X protein [Hylaeus anthracinus]|uniref:phosphatidylinositol-glycan biosynthesis class X protein n=1 Tax=Hylaeus anthracinus TaxID=313031 RepID=UPI0023B8D31A|nr:phosphatidylinositol-glycan biosynthesis class X protein [Hylaeus anthracinus]